MENNQAPEVHSTKPKSGMLTGMFANRDEAEHAYNLLHERGYSKDDINVVMSDETRKKHYSHEVETTELGTKASEGAGKGLAIGGTIGAIAGIIAAIGTTLVGVGSSGTFGGRVSRC